MFLEHKRQSFSPSCPSGGKWYACAPGSPSAFAGCCSEEACDKNGCPDGSLEPASFDPSQHGLFLDLSCPSGSQFWTCTGTNPVFMGCCKVNACQNDGCPDGDLVQAYIGDPSQAAAYSATTPSGASSTATAKSTSRSTLSARSSATTSSSVLSAATTESAPATGVSTTPTSAATTVVVEHKSTNLGPIVGGAVGGLAAFAIIAGLLIYYARHASKSRKDSRNTVQSRLSFSQDPGAFGAVGPAEYTEETKPGMRASLPPDYASPTPSYAPYRDSASEYTAPQPLYEMPSDHGISPGYYKPVPRPYSGSISRKALSPQASASPGSPDSQRLSEAPGDHHFPVEMDGARRTSAPQTPQTPQTPSSVRSSGANWTAHPWQGGPDRGLAIEAIDEREGSVEGPGQFYPRT